MNPECSTFQPKPHPCTCQPHYFAWCQYNTWDSRVRALAREQGRAKEQKERMEEQKSSNLKVENRTEIFQPIKT